MNFVYVHTHDSGRYFQPYGYGMSTTWIQHLAEESVLFRQAYCNSPTCSPSRATLLTGMMPHSNGMYGLAHRGFSLSEPGRHLAWFLRNNGYDTALSGVQHEARDPLSLGYERLLSVDNEKNLTRRERDIGNAHKAAEFILEQHNKPFFLSFGMSNTHRPYPDHTSSRINPDYLVPPWPFQDTKENREDMADYYAAVQTVDECVGIIMQALEKSRRTENTILLFTTDHGLPWPRMKCTLNDTGIGVAMIMRFPGNRLKGRATDTLVSHIDVFPTLCDLMDLEKPSWLQGVSMLPLLEHDAVIRDAVFAEVNYHAAYEPMRCVRTERYKLIIRYDDYRYPLLSNIDQSPVKQRWIEAGYPNTVIPREELYDLRLDPAERNNLAYSAEYNSVYNDLLNRLNDWMRLTEDPILTCRERIPKPDGAIVNRRESIDPSAKNYE